MASEANARPWQPPPHVEAMALLVRQKQFIIVFTLSAALTALLLTYVYSEKYEAGTSVFYRNAEITLLRPVDQQAFGSPAPSTPFKVVSKSVDDIVHSWAILEPVVKELNLTADERIYDGPFWKRWYKKTKDYIKDAVNTTWIYLKYGRYIEPNPVAKAIEQVSSNLEIVNKDSYIFVIQVRDKRPERAAMIADSAARNLVNFLRDQSIAAGTAKRQQIEGLMQAKDSEIKQRRSAIDAFMTEHLIVSTTEEINRGTERASSLDQLYVSVQAELAENRSKLETIRSLLDGRHRDKGYMRPEVRQRLESEALSIQVAIDGASAKLVSLEDSISTLRARLRELPTLDLQLQQMTTELDGTKRDWVQLRDALQEAIVRENQVSSEVQILHVAGIPKAPVAPIKAYHVGLAASLGVLLSVAMVFVLNFFNIRVLFKSLGPAARRAAPARSGPPGGSEGGSPSAQAGGTP